MPISKTSYRFRFALVWLFCFAPLALCGQDDIETLKKKIEALEIQNSQLAQENAALKNTLHQTEANHAIDAVPETPSEGLKSKAPEARLWKWDIALGANLTRGNSRTQLVEMKTHWNRKSEVDNYKFSLSGKYGTSSGETNAERLKGTFDYDRDIVGDWFWTTGVTGEYDQIQEIEYRITGSPGLGYRLFDSDKFKLTLLSGPAIVYEKLQNNEAGTSLGLRIGEEFSWQIFSNTRLFQNFEIVSGGFEDYFINTEIGVQTSMTQDLSLRVGVEDRYNSDPGQDKLKNDISLTSAIVYTY